MGQVTVSLNGRAYRLQCGDGEEARLRELAGHLNRRIEELTRKFGRIADDRLLVMAGLLIADELWEAKDKLRELTELVEKRLGRDGASGKARGAKAAKGKSKAKGEREAEPEREPEPDAVA